MDSTSIRVLAYIAIALVCYSLSFTVGTGGAALLFFVVGAIFELALWFQAFRWFRASRSRDSRSRNRT